MFQRFTDRARRATVLAQDEARARYYAYIGTEHLLMGLMREGEGVAYKVLSEFTSIESLRGAMDELSPVAPESELPHHIPFTTETKNALEHSLREAIRLGHHYIGTEHILLALIREDVSTDDMAPRLLIRCGVDPIEVYKRTIERLFGYEVASYDYAKIGQQYADLVVKLHAAEDAIKDAIEWRDSLTRELGELEQKIARGNREN